MGQLTAGDVAELLKPTGVTYRQLQHWLQHGVITPSSGGGTQGSHRRFSVMRAVGVVVAAKVWKGEQGCCEAYITKLVDAFAAVPELWLRDQFAYMQTGTARPLTHLSHIANGRPVLQSPVWAGQVDVRAVYDAVKARAQEQERAAEVSSRQASLAGSMGWEQD